jgi:L-iditol 2-dehydrogenase
MKNDMLTVTLIKPGEFAVTREPIPVPGPGEVLVKVAYVGVCGSDWTIFKGLHPYAISPLIMGHEFSGTVAACGEGASLPIRTRVAVIPHLVCGACDACASQTYNFCEQLRCTGAEAHGAHREYIAMPKEMVLPVPDGMDLVEAAMLEPACVAYHGARRAPITPDTTALIVGAGPIGNYCMQSVKALGAKRVIVADVDETRLALAEKMGADATLNVREAPLSEGLARLPGGGKAVDVFYDCVGEKGLVLNQILKIARRGSEVVVIGVLQKGYELPNLPDFVQHELRLSGTTMYTPRDYRGMMRLMSEGKVRSDSLITHRWKLKQVPEVFDFIASRREPFFKMLIEVEEP